MTGILIILGVCVILGAGLRFGLFTKEHITNTAPICPDCGLGEMRHVETCHWYEASTGYSDERSIWQCTRCSVVFEEADLERELIGRGGGDAA